VVVGAAPEEGLEVSADAGLEVGFHGHGVERGRVGEGRGGPARTPRPRPPAMAAAATYAVADALRNSGFSAPSPEARHLVVLCGVGGHPAASGAANELLDWVPPGCRGTDAKHDMEEAN
jgi:hypothetical protein